MHKKNGKRKILILHFKNSKFYPPVMNMNRHLLVSGFDVLLLSEKTVLSYRSRFHKLAKKLLYLRFILRTLFYIEIRGYRRVLYYESLSAVPLVLSPSYHFKRLKIYGHNHEYFPKDDIWKFSRLDKLGRRIESISIFKRIKWLSHTNEVRLEKFKKEYPSINIDCRLDTLRNLPPGEWKETIKVLTSLNVIRIVHIGTLSLENHYLEDLLEVYGNDTRYEITFFSHYISDDVNELLVLYENVILLGSISYYDLPKLQGHFHLGLILYRGNSQNFIWNEPNKLFEYLALGLKVLCSDDLKLVQQRCVEGKYTGVIMCKFDQPPRFDELRTLIRANNNSRGVLGFQDEYVKLSDFIE